MPAFVDLAVLGKPEALAKFMPVLESLLSPDAWRDREIENQVKARYPDSRRCFIRWQRFEDDLLFPIDQHPEAICFDEPLLYPGRLIFLTPGFPPLLADFFYRFVKPAAEQLGLTGFSTAFEETPPQWGKRRRRSHIEFTLGWCVARQLFTERYVSPLPVCGKNTGQEIDEESIWRELCTLHRSCQN